MKKIGIILMISSVVASAAAKTTKTTTTAPTATMTFEQRYDAISNQLDALRAKDDQRFQLEQQKADNAQAKLDKQVEMRDELQAKYEEAAQLAKISYYKATYGPVANQYKDLLGKLDSSIKENQKIIDNFEKLSAARDAYAQ